MEVDGASYVQGRGGRQGARQAERSAGSGRSLKRKSRHSGSFWFSDPMLRHDPVFDAAVQVIAHATIKGSGY